MNVIPQEDVYESPDYSGPVGYGRALNVSEWDDSAEMPIAQGFEIPMSYTDDQLAALRGIPNFQSDTNLSDNIRAAYLDGEDDVGPLLSESIRGAIQSAPSYARRRRYRSRPTSYSRKYRVKRRTYTRKRKYVSKKSRKLKRRVVSKKRRYKKRKPSAVVYIR